MIFLVVIYKENTISGSESTKSVDNDKFLSFLKDEKEIEDKISKIDEDYNFIRDCCHALVLKMNKIDKQNERILEILEKQYDNPVIDTMDNFSNEKVDQNLKEQIIEYYKKNGTLYPSDVAEALELNLKDVVDVVKGLIKSGELEVA